MRYLIIFSMVRKALQAPKALLHILGSPGCQFVFPAHCIFPLSCPLFPDMSDAMGNVSLKAAKGYGTKGQRRRKANKALVESSDVQEPQWKRSRKQGVKKAAGAMGEEVLLNMVLQSKKAESNHEEGDG